MYFVVNPVGITMQAVAVRNPMPIKVVLIERSFDLCRCEAFPFDRKILNELNAKQVFKLQKLIVNGTGLAPGLY